MKSVVIIITTNGIKADKKTNPNPNKKKEAVKMEKTIDVKFKDLRIAVVALNESKLLKDPIKLVGIAKDQILKDFMKAVEAVPDKDGKFPGPKVALDFYNGVLDLQEAAKKGIAPPKPAAAAKDKAAGKTKAAPKEKKDKALKGPGVIETILTIIKKGPAKTKEQILDDLVAAFPDRDKEKMAKTVQVQIGGKKETRMEKEKGVKFKITADGKYSIAKK
jgi:hypothetical protein